MKSTLRTNIYNWFYNGILPPLLKAGVKDDEIQAMINVLDNTADDTELYSIFKDFKNNHIK